MATTVVAVIGIFSFLLETSFYVLGTVASVVLRWASTTSAH